jgi:hypothetical protein
MAFFRLVDGSQKLRVIGVLVDRPKARKGFPEALHVTHGKEPDGNDAFVRHLSTP